MYEIWNYTLKEFIGNYPVIDDDPPGSNSLTLDKKNYFLKKEILSFKNKIYIPNKKIFNETIDDIYITHTWCSESDIIIFKQINSFNYILGGYIGPSLWVDNNYRCLGIGSRLVIEKAYKEKRNPIPESYTTAGYYTHKKAHKLSVMDAINKKKNISNFVVKDYIETM